jgi:16S rRNA processing protein RimM
VSLSLPARSRPGRGRHVPDKARAGPADARPCVCVAQIGAPYGVRGEVRLKSFTADPKAVAHYGPLQTEDGRQSFEIEATLAQQKDALIVRLRGIGDRNAAEGLRNLRLYIPRARLPATEDSDTFYHADLIGLAVVDTQGAVVGKVAAMHNFGAGDLIEVEPLAGPPTVLLPFTATAVPSVDIAGGRLVVAPPPDAPEPGEVLARKRSG